MIFLSPVSDDAMRLGSLFTGYGGLDMAVEQFFDAETVWCSDIDPGACKIIEHRIDAPNLGDITMIDWATVEPVDILTAGWPCQPFSLAGKRKGALDERALWPHVAGAVRALRPRHVVLENVAAIATAGELSRATADLAAIGYVGQWRCLRAADIGAPHGRARIFIVATDTEINRQQRRWATRDGRPGFEDSGRVASNARRGGRREEDSRGCNMVGESGLQSGWDESPSPSRSHRHAVADTESIGWREGWPEPAGQLGGSDAVECGAGAVADTESDTGWISNGDGRTSTDADSNRVRQQPVALAGGSGTPVAWGRYEAAIRRWERVLGRVAPAPTEPGPKGSRRLSPRFEEWMMGLPAGWVTDVPGLSRNAQMRALGNGVVPQQAFAAMIFLSPVSNDQRLVYHAKWRARREPRPNRHDKTVEASSVTARRKPTQSRVTAGGDPAAL